MRFASALSEHPLATHAVGEVVGDLLDRIGPSPDLVVVFVTGPLVGALDDILPAIQALLTPSAMIGTSAVGVLGGAREAEDVAALSVWAGNVGSAEAVRLTTSRLGGSVTVEGLPDGLGVDEPATLILLADPFSFQTDELLAQVAAERPHLSIVGGLASSARGPNGNRMILDDDVFTNGAVGAILPPDAVTNSVVSQGCRPVGDPFTITKVKGNRIFELGGRPAIERLEELVAAASDEEKRALSAGLHIGLVANPNSLEFARGDFVIRSVLGVDRSTGALAIGDYPEVGDVVQFQARDADTASEDLGQMLHDATPDDRFDGSPQAALVFTCNGRGTHLFGEPHHDASTVHELTGGAEVAGMFCAGEIGPIGGRNHMHGFTASTLMFY